MAFLDVSYFQNAYSNHRRVHSNLISNMDTNTFINAKKQTYSNLEEL